MKTLRIAVLSCVTLAVLCAGTALGQTRMYKCVDEKGKVYYTQTPPKECLGRETQELSRQGQVTKRSEAALTPEQQAAREEERKKQAEKEAAEREEKRKNQALLSTYSNEKDIEDTRARAIKENDATIQEIQKLIANAEKRKKALDAEKEFYQKKPMPPKLQEDIKNNEIEIRNQLGAMQAKKKQVAAINAKYDDDKRRYVELTKSASAPAAKAAPKK